MVHVLPAPAESPFDFTPVASRPRRDGWTPATQTAFITALADGDSVTAACRRVGRSPKSAYALRQRPDAASFAAAWNAAVEHLADVADGTAIERCLVGTRRPILYRGRIVGERVVYDDRLLLHVLRRSAPRPTMADPYTAFHEALHRLDSNRPAGIRERFA